jgi:hypothetical protein
MQAIGGKTPQFLAVDFRGTALGGRHILSDGIFLAKQRDLQLLALT